MNPSANVKFANHAARSTGTTRRVLSAIESTGSYETDPARPHAPRVGRLNVVVAIGLQFNISRTTESPSATGKGYSKPECECSIPLRLTRQRRWYPPRSPRSMTAWDSKIPYPNWCARCCLPSSRPLSGSSLGSHSACEVAACCRLSSVQTRPRERIDYPQTESAFGRIPRPAHRIILTNLRFAVTPTHLSQHWMRGRSHSSSSQISRGKR